MTNVMDSLSVREVAISMLMDSIFMDNVMDILLRIAF
jgi:hypothetical protein